MVYIYKKTIGTKSYYYLRASERKGKKIVVKDIAYLGNNITEAKKTLEKLPKYKEEIRNAYKNIHRFLESNHYLEKALLLKQKRDELLAEKQNEIEACRLHYNTAFKNKDELTKKETLQNFAIEFAFNTTSIEGNTITLQQTKTLLQEGLTPENKTLREIYDLQNTKRVLSLLNSKEELSHELINKIHSELMQNIDLRKGYRTTDVRVIRANFEATPAPYVKADMDILLKWYEENKKTHPLTLATIFHHKFEKIHPFMDGNGRTGRMLLNYILLQNNYPPLVIYKKSRTDYLNALRTADKQKDINKTEAKNYKELVMFTSNQLIESYWNIFL